MYIDETESAVTSSLMGVRSIVVSMYVCLSARMSEKPHIQSLQNCLYTLLVAVARSSSDDSVITLCG